MMNLDDWVWDDLASLLLSWDCPFPRPNGYKCSHDLQVDDGDCSKHNYIYMQHLTILPSYCIENI
jgi:hypothetical protein